MRLYKKVGNTLHILCFPGEDVGKGSYILIEDRRVGKSLIAQVIDIQFANVPGVMEELLRDQSVGDHIEGEDFDPLGIGSHLVYIQDARLLICKIHGTLKDGVFSLDSSWLPSRTHSTIKRLSVEALLGIVGVGRNLPIEVGETMEASRLMIDAYALDILKNYNGAIV